MSGASDFILRSNYILKVRNTQVIQKQTLTKKTHGETKNQIT
jgi:hypothetical protein